MDMAAVVGVVEVICQVVPATILSLPSDLTPLQQGGSTDVIDPQTELIQVLYDSTVYWISMRKLCIFLKGVEL